MDNIYDSIQKIVEYIHETTDVECFRKFSNLPLYVLSSYIDSLTKMSYLPPMIYNNAFSSMSGRIHNFEGRHLAKLLHSASISSYLPSKGFNFEISSLIVNSLNNKYILPYGEELYTIYPALGIPLRKGLISKNKIEMKNIYDKFNNYFNMLDIIQTMQYTIKNTSLWKDSVIINSILNTKTASIGGILSSCLLKHMNKILCKKNENSEKYKNIEKNENSLSEKNELNSRMASLLLMQMCILINYGSVGGIINNINNDMNNNMINNNNIINNNNNMINNNNNIIYNKKTHYTYVSLDILYSLFDKCLSALENSNTTTSASHRQNFYSLTILCYSEISSNSNRKKIFNIINIDILYKLSKLFVSEKLTNCFQTQDNSFNEKERELTTTVFEGEVQACLNNITISELSVCAGPYLIDLLIK
eukprot:GHVL01003028.1.p1 GENE.GHVL01003028.1~~GHVL01003028.1.p1  ORF type:complete len:419 (+),score=121.21 GHVL01003028.1:1544-2800(+)